MKVTAIKQQVKRADRFSIYVDGAYSFSLSDNALLESKLAGGQELSVQQVKEYKKLSGDDKLYNQALRYAAMRSRSSWELEFYLKRKQADPTLIEQILSRLTKLHFVDDLEFARSWVANRRLLKSVSQRRLAQELRQKHVPDTITEQVLAEDKLDTDELATLRQLVERKRRQTKYGDDQKLMQFLARQGFSYTDIKQVLQSQGDPDD